MKDRTYITCDGTLLAEGNSSAGDTPSYGELTHIARPHTDNAVAALRCVYACSSKSDLQTVASDTRRSWARSGGHCRQGRGLAVHCLNYRLEQGQAIRVAHARRVFDAVDQDGKLKADQESVDG